MPAPGTEMQQRFAIEYANNGGNGTAAAKAAGYSEKSAHEIARQLLEKPAVQTMIHKELMRLRYRSGVVGLNALTQIAEDTRLPAAARVQAARALMEHAGQLGTGKEMAEARAAAEAEPDSRLLDPREVLAALAKGRGAIQ